MNSKISPFLRAIIYADLFNFPLTKDELWRYAISDKKIDVKDFDDFLKNPPITVQKVGTYFFLTKRNLILQRERKNAVATKKRRIAKRVAVMLAKIPTVLFIGISGGLALNNADKDDDIDFFIITKPHTIWITRFLVTCLLEVKDVRRKRDGKQADRICVNMYMDGGRLQIKKSGQDLYVAHEVAQVYPLFNRLQTYEQFLKANSWIQSFLPNATSLDVSTITYKQGFFTPVFNWVFHISFLENFFGYIQRFYMKPHRTREVISDTILAFHPFDYRGRTIKEYEKRIKAYEKI